MMVGSASSSTRTHPVAAAAVGDTSGVYRRNRGDIAYLLAGDGGCAWVQLLALPTFTACLRVVPTGYCIWSNENGGQNKDKLPTLDLYY